MWGVGSIGINIIFKKNPKKKKNVSKGELTKEK